MRPVTCRTARESVQDRVVDQPQQRGLRGHQGSACLLLGETLQADAQREAMLVDERLELDLGRLVDDVLRGTPCWVGHPPNVARRASNAHDAHRHQPGRRRHRAAGCPDVSVQMVEDVRAGKVRDAAQSVAFRALQEEVADQVRLAISVSEGPCHGRQHKTVSQSRHRRRNERGGGLCGTNGCLPIGDGGQERTSGNSGRAVWAEHEDRVGQERFTEARFAEPRPRGSEVADTALDRGGARFGSHQDLLHPARTGHKLSDLLVPHHRRREGVLLCHRTSCSSAHPGRAESTWRHRDPRLPGQPSRRVRDSHGMGRQASGRSDSVTTSSIQTWGLQHGASDGRRGSDCRMPVNAPESGTLRATVKVAWPVARTSRRRDGRADGKGLPPTGNTCRLATRRCTT